MSGDHLACSDLEDYVTGETRTEDRAVEEEPMTDYGMAVTTTLSMEDAEAQIRAALAEQGFGVLTEIDVAATLKQKIDVDRPPYKILGACNPHLANQALLHDEAIGLLLPCNVTLSATEEGTVVAIVDPTKMLAIAGQSDEMDRLSADARSKLATALATLPVLA
jgi:uncharacterized protein (DUF302 family)